MPWGLLVLLGMAGCASTPDGKVFPASTSILPAGGVKVSPNYFLTWEKLGYTAAGGYLLYFIYDPLAPNWELEEARLDEDTYFVAMKAKRFRTGGDGEALALFKRRAKQLQYVGKYADVQILEFSEGVESQTPVAQRVAQGVFRLVRGPNTPAAPLAGGNPGVVPGPTPVTVKAGSLTGPMPVPATERDGTGESGNGLGQGQAPVETRSPPLSPSTP